MSLHEHTIAQVTIGNVAWWIDWPNDPEDETIRDVSACAIYDSDGVMVEVIEPVTFDLRIPAEYTSAGQVLEAALEWLDSVRNPGGEGLQVSWCNGVRPGDGIHSLPEHRAARFATDLQWLTDGERQQLTSRVAERIQVEGAES